MITVPSPGKAVISADGVATYMTQSVSLDVYHANDDRVVLRLSIGSTATVFELDGAARDHLIARLRGEP